MKDLIPIFILVLFFSCSPKSNVQLPDNIDTYKEDITSWQEGRLKSIKSPKGWLTVIGLHWLQEGRNTIGSKKNSDIVLPEEAGSKIGDIYLEGDEIFFKSFPEAYVSKNEKRFESGNLISDASRIPTELAHKSFYFYVIRRGNKYGLRVKNTLADSRFDFEKIDNFNINPQFRFIAKVKEKISNDSILINDIAGISTMYKVVDRLEFRHSGKDYDLLAFDGGKDKYFITFTDNTSGNSTYGGGRFIYVEKPKNGLESTIIDFNKAYNPPCAFTDYATCPIPPPENHINFEIKAGEKKVNLH